MRFQLPDRAVYVLEQLEKNGYEAYPVGGCVRDMILGKQPGDIDFCTSALPDEAAACFPDCRVLKTGIRHGTIAVRIGDEQFEITTYRIDGDYTDHRHPNQVIFARTLREDLSRRDFTINAMAYHPRFGLIDFFGGEEDLRSGLVRCVGDPKKRFEEDALRVMRALRFAAMLNFRIEPETAKAAVRMRGLLHLISAERIRSEFDKLLCAPGAHEVLTGYPLILSEILPELKAFLLSAQWGQSADAICRTAPRVTLRLTAMLTCVRHYDAQFTVEQCDMLLRRLKYDLSTIKTVRELFVLVDEGAECSPISVKNRLRSYGTERFGQYLEVLPALGMSDKAQCLTDLFDKIIRENQCYRIGQLAVGGEDLIAIGIPQGPRVGQILNALLDRVIGGSLENERSALLKTAKQLCDDPLYTAISRGNA